VTKCLLLLIILTNLTSIHWEVESLHLTWPAEQKPTTTVKTMRIEGRQATAAHTSTAMTRCNNRGTAVHSEVAAELGQGRNRPAQGQGRSRRKLAV